MIRVRVGHFMLVLLYLNVLFILTLMPFDTSRRGLAEYELFVLSREKGVCGVKNL